MFYLGGFSGGGVGGICLWKNFPEGILSRGIARVGFFQGILSVGEGFFEEDGVQCVTKSSNFILLKFPGIFFIDEYI